MKLNINLIQNSDAMNYLQNAPTDPIYYVNRDWQIPVSYTEK